MQLITKAYWPVKSMKRNPFKKPDFQSHCCHLIGDMLNNGFSLVEVLQFFKKLTKVDAQFGESLLEKISVGETIPRSFEEIGFPPTLVLQLEMAEVHGNLAETFLKMGRFVDLKIQQKKAIAKAIMYPALLLSFILSFILALRFVILPQLQSIASFEEATLLNILLNIPTYLIVGSCFLAVALVISRHFFQKKSALWQATFLSQFPFVGDLYRIYLTAMISGELGKLFSLGIELKEIYLLLTQQKASPLLQELGKVGLEAGRNGEDLKTVLVKERFLQPEFTLMIQTGEMRGKLAEELLYYSQIMWQNFTQKVQKKIQFIQPICFLVVAILVVVLYASLLLPIYNQTWEVLE